MDITFSPARSHDRLQSALAALYGPQATPVQAQRYRHLLSGLEETFGPQPRAALFSAPGRTEIGGNHTDHQHGRVLTGSVNLDIIAAVAPTGGSLIRVQSEGFPLIEVDLADLTARPEEHNTTAALIRGVAAWFAAQGHALEGLCAYITSQVLSGSGLSSSAAFEVLTATILNDLFCGGQYDPVQIAKVGQYAENLYFGKPSGLLDQMGASVGGMVAIDFQDNDNPQAAKVDFDFSAAGHALCIVDSGADHADLTPEYAAVPAELGEICAYFGKAVLREVPEDEFSAALPALRRAAGDRAVLRAIHVYGENRRVEGQVAALQRGDFDGFLALVRQSGLSSWRFLQDITPAGAVRHQEVALALALAEQLLDGRGACRVHGGGFAGTIQAFVPLDLLDKFKAGMESVLGEGRCHVLAIRPVGGVRLV
ncbi:galactokinase [Pseudoflavonifractor sp. 524-17]|uniref:galactokinase n=1 Tax=Pseudoflavonifractor sp. 524-17 TaxID=2304577 RepID=UPI00137AE130|nr:galactokinase family protein [Pseudoflavonifractor sp. 524-17]NCE66001.1 galactokinase [Pseudoflavonifractor sp. 524-17]